MNEFLLDLRSFHPSLVSSLKLPPFSYSLSQFPSLSVRIPPYLSEQGESDCFRAEERKKERKEEKKKRKGIKRGKVGGTKVAYLKSTKRCVKDNLETGRE